MKRNRKDKKEVRVAAKSFFGGFKEFITKGNVIDMAVGVIIGGAFGKIVSSLVNDIIMPPIGVLIGGVDFKDLNWIIKREVLDSTGKVLEAAVSIKYGNFIMIILEFLIIAFTIYTVLNMVIRRKQFVEKVEKELEELNKVEEPEEVEEIVEEPSEEILLLREIRDSLKK